MTSVNKCLLGLKSEAIVIMTMILIHEDMIVPETEILWRE
jgi:hypothetical protein